MLAMEGCLLTWRLEQAIRNMEPEMLAMEGCLLTWMGELCLCVIEHVAKHFPHTSLSVAGIQLLPAPATLC
jgi:hypothetical protein